MYYYVMDKSRRVVLTAIFLYLMNKLISFKPLEKSALRASLLKFIFFIMIRELIHLLKGSYVKQLGKFSQHSSFFKSS